MKMMNTLEETMSGLNQTSFSSMNLCPVVRVSQTVPHPPWMLPIMTTRERAMPTMRTVPWMKSV